MPLCPPSTTPDHGPVRDGRLDAFLLGHADAYLSETGIRLVRGKWVWGTWRSSDDRLSGIDEWPSEEDCRLYARAWSTCEDNATRDCLWGTGSKEVQAISDRNFRFF